MDNESAEANHHQVRHEVRIHQRHHALPGQKDDSPTPPKLARKLDAQKPVPAFRKAHPGGRPTKCTPPVTDEICRAIRLGSYFDVACNLAGLDDDTGGRWLKWGARYDQGLTPEGTQGKRNPKHHVYAEFSRAVRTAQAEAEHRDVMILSKAALGDPANNIPPQWRAAAFKLERRNRKRWGRQEFVEHSTGERAQDADIMDRIRAAAASLPEAPPTLHGNDERAALQDSDDEEEEHARDD